MSTQSVPSSAGGAAAIGFWEIGQYKANVQRIHEGADQLKELTRLIKERIEIESRYGTSLEQWNQRWRAYSDRQVPEGTLKSSLDGVLEESKELARVHLAVKDRFNDEVIKTVELFKKDNYHRSKLRGFREAKEIEEEFEKAQKQWKKLFDRVDAAKRNYHGLARAEKSAYIQMMNSKAESIGQPRQNGHSGPQENANGTVAQDKGAERFERCRDEVKKARAIYEQHVKEIAKYNTVYKEGMDFVFEKCQQMELKRMRFYVEMLSGVQKVLIDLVNPQKLLQIHRNLEHQLAIRSDSLKSGPENVEDLKRWSIIHGRDAPMKWPTFEEYTTELRHIGTGSAHSKSVKSQDVNATNGGVILTKKIVKTDDDAVVLVQPKHPEGNSVDKIPRQRQNGNGWSHHKLVTSASDSVASDKSSATATGSAKSYEAATAEGSQSSSINDETFKTAFDTPPAEDAAETQRQPPQSILKKSPAKISDATSMGRDNATDHRSLHQHPQLMAKSSNQFIFIDRTTTSAASDPSASSAGAIHPAQKPTGAARSDLNGGGMPKRMNNIAADPLAEDPFPMPTPKRPVELQSSQSNPSNNQSKNPPEYAKLFPKKAQYQGQSSSQDPKFPATESALRNGVDNGTSSATASSNIQQQQQPPMPKGPARAMYRYVPIEDDEISLSEGEILQVISGPDPLGWCVGEKATGSKRVGLFPSGYVRPMGISNGSAGSSNMNGH